MCFDLAFINIHNKIKNCTNCQQERTPPVPDYPMSGRTTRAVNRQFIFKQESNKGKQSSSQSSGSSGVVVKKEPDTSPVVKKKPGSAKKEKADSNSREARVEDLRKKYPHAVIELSLSLIADDLKELADTISTEKDSIRGFLIVSFKRIMVRMFWLDPDVRAVIVRVLLPNHVNVSEYASYETYVNKAYLHLSMKWRKLVDEMASEILNQLKENVGDNEMIEGVLTTHESFTEKFQLQNEDIITLWRFANATIVPGIITTPVAAPGTLHEMWHQWVRGVTLRYLRKRMWQMWIAGGQVNTAGGLEIVKEKEFLDFAAEYFQHPRFAGVNPNLPPIATTIPRTPAEWVTFITQSERLVVVLEDTVEETVKSSILPTAAVCSKLVKKLQNAERFEESELELLEDDIDIEALNELHDPIQVTGEVEVTYRHIGAISDGNYGIDLVVPRVETSDYRQRGELLACLSTFGLMEYLNHRFEMEHDYLAGIVVQLNNKLELIEEFRAKLQKMAEDKERRTRLVSTIEEQAIVGMKGALASSALKRSTSSLMSATIPQPAAKLQRLTGTFGNRRRNVIGVHGGGQLVLGSRPKGEMESTLVSGRRSLNSGHGGGHAMLRGGSPKGELEPASMSIGRDSEGICGTNVKVEGQLFMKHASGIHGEEIELDDSGPGSPLRDEDMYRDEN